MKYKIGDIVSIEPFGDSPTHFCKIQYFKNNAAYGDWYSKEANCVSDCGFYCDYIKIALEKDLIESISNFELKNTDNHFWYAALENYRADFLQGSSLDILDFISEFKRLNSDGKHPFDCKCIICR